MKPKNILKKIRRVEARLQKGAKKLAKLKQKLAAATKGGTAKKSTARASETRKSAKNRRLTPIQERLTEVKQRPTAAKKAKRKLNLTPERRAQLAAAMKARWAAKRAAAEANAKDTPSHPGATSEQISQP
jgi:DNA anti-recombination protein RmuC